MTLACYLTWVAGGFPGFVPLGVFPWVVAGGRAAVLRSWRGGLGLVCRVLAQLPVRAVPGGCSGTPAGPGGSQAAGGAGPLPGQPQVGGEVAGAPELGVAGT